ncbi:hypothetical protein Acy02nite_91330 [Actinoplanes cyaneus]|uniref:Uncharacterized protein n=1 Tax=Actinoplanes cyaneus TaxID=52696 RepID=A0A919IVI0_9ACTN|nr:hypothetical protein [Actinoplanes cyaneus]MCW2144490.1 hypothetical protein [Actinoplanes cyaneus]GID71252.1 hypothetical protein Acy02nite_91330 [Actinoplanes cyaneus]
MRSKRLATAVALAVFGVVTAAGPAAAANADGQMYEPEDWTRLAADAIWVHRGPILKCAANLTSYVLTMAEGIPAPAIVTAEEHILNALEIKHDSPYQYCHAARALADGLRAVKDADEPFFFSDSSYKIRHPGIRLNECWIVIDAGPSADDAERFEDYYRGC